MPSILEVVAVIFSMLSVVLTIKKNLWLWPTGIVGVLAFLGIFWNAHLYSDTTLQVIFLAQSIYGWYFWLHPKKYQTKVPVTYLDDAEKVLFGAVCLGAIMGIGIALTRFTNDSMPFLDASIGVLSVAAQWLLMCKVFENWHLWIVVNLISIYVYFSKGLTLTASEYVVFLILAVIGLRKWHRELPLAYDIYEETRGYGGMVGAQYYLDTYAAKVQDDYRMDDEIVIFKDGKLTEEGLKLFYIQQEFGFRGPHE